MSNKNRSSDTQTTKLLKVAVLAFLLGNAFADMLLIEDMQTQINELKLKHDEKVIVCLQNYKIQSKFNYVLTCNGVNN